MAVIVIEIVLVIVMMVTVMENSNNGNNKLIVSLIDSNIGVNDIPNNQIHFDSYDIYKCKI